MRITLLLLILTCTNQLHSWGFEPHKRINEQACLILPKPLFGFYKKHLSFMIAHATDADMRRYIDTLEASKHYIDLEHYGNCIDSVPQSYLEAIELFGEEHLNSEGSLPWALTKQVMKLKYAFGTKDITYILKTSADLGHYIADAHVPLHTTENYNGQLSNQKGIHGLWETRIPQLFLDTIIVPKPIFEFNPDWEKEIRTVIEESHNLTHSVLQKEREVREILPESRWYQFQQNKQVVTKQYSLEYVNTYHEFLDLMVEKRFIASTQMFAKLLFTAWVLAGEPNLDTDQSIEEISTPESAIIPMNSIHDSCNH